ncbi:hypothetical protein [uncultured Nostoc sp.]|uniref:hypothetical protein n=1 Tax=uncultured Nostoc sp. TaxID=340711 RepID=UPI0035C9787D
MAIATRYTTTLSPTITQQSLGDAIKAMAASIGLSLYGDITSGTTRLLVYEITTDASKTFGKCYFRIRVESNLIIGQRLFSSYDLVGATGSNGGTELATSAFSTSSAISINGFAGSELKLVCLSQGTTLFAPFGVILPSFRPSWWNLNSYPWGFLFSTASANTLSSSLLSPYGNALYNTFLNNSNLSNINPISGLPDLIKGMLILSQSNAGVGGATSGDIGFGSFNGQTRYSSLIPQDTTEQYCIINNVAGGLAIRTG